MDYAMLAVEVDELHGEMYRLAEELAFYSVVGEVREVEVLNEKLAVVADKVKNLLGDVFLPGEGEDLRQLVFEEALEAAFQRDQSKFDGSSFLVNAFNSYATMYLNGLG